MKIKLLLCFVIFTLLTSCSFGIGEEESGSQNKISIQNTNFFDTEEASKLLRHFSLSGYGNLAIEGITKEDQTIEFTVEEWKEGVIQNQNVYSYTDVGDDFLGELLITLKESEKKENVYELKITTLYQNRGGATSSISEFDVSKIAENDSISSFKALNSYENEGFEEDQVAIWGYVASINSISGRVLEQDLKSMATQVDFAIIVTMSVKTVEE
ncbi:hypothetical protein [Longirhabdus pacifica]|uniref:hypothetical protein n=1 Tax=Longirhabdus pacifica TaxID=2305227 RepID=UPI001008BE26|nr:hypothetical protein [Longirhabdus pacifica]